jgi:hypothetical protein
MEPIPWGKCKICGATTYAKRWAGRKPEQCDKCRKIAQDKYREKLKEKENGNS